eukprot:Hpha_TRINITY_DN33520_c0_g1::TRINITY_DN33520_c0_g1_i1::g.171140::m.171140
MGSFDEELTEYRILELRARRDPVALTEYQEIAVRAELVAAEACARRSTCSAAVRGARHQLAAEREHEMQLAKAREELQRRRAAELRTAEQEAAARRLARERAELEGQLRWDREEQDRKVALRLQLERERRDEERHREAQQMKENFRREEEVIRWRAEKRRLHQWRVSRLEEAEETARSGFAEEETAERNEVVDAPFTCLRRTLQTEEHHARMELEFSEAFTCVVLRGLHPAHLLALEAESRLGLAFEAFKDCCAAACAEGQRLLAEAWQVVMDDVELAKRERERHAIESEADMRRRREAHMQLRRKHQEADEELRAWRETAGLRPLKIQELRQKSAERRKKHEIAVQRSSAVISRLQNTVEALPQGGALAYLRTNRPLPGPSVLSESSSLSP